MKPCTVCDSKHRKKIERALFKVAPEGSSLTLENIAEEFEVSVEDLRRHILYHTPYGCEEGSDSIVRRMKTREADLLGEVAQEYSDTLKMVGGRIRSYIEDDDSGTTFEKKLSKSSVDLYLGCGDNLQKTVKAIADIDNLLNGPKDDGLQGLAALANAIHSSRQMAGESDD